MLLTSTAIAGTYVPSGDLALRHDVQRLADYGVIKGPVTTWPIAWGAILGDLYEADTTSLPPPIVDAVARLKARAIWEASPEVVVFNSKVGFADDAARIRSFQNTPRGRVEVAAGVAYMNNWLSADVNVQYLDSKQDDDDLRFDESMLGVAFGNWSISASTQQRWWGPSWDGSLILSNNARPIPALVLDRIASNRFETDWLRWLGPWDLTVMMGRLEDDRAVPNARYFGMRFNFRPLSSLEIGVSRSAQWCGDGRPCDFGTFVDLLAGRDNQGGDGIGSDNEPGNQLAGFDVRWSPRMLGSTTAFYGQLIGEDEAGGFPSRYMGQFGAEWSTYLGDRWSTRFYGEFSDTTCQFHESSKIYNCAYNHGTYATGYRFRERSIGHGADNDARIFAVGAVAVDADDTQWRAHLRVGDLNRGGNPDPRNTLTPGPQDFLSLDVSHSRVIPFGVVDIGVGYESVDDATSGESTDDARLYLQWRSSF